MPIRGLASFNYAATGYHAPGVVMLGFHYAGGQHPSEAFDGNFTIPLSDGGAGIKAALTAAVKACYDSTPSVEYDPWDPTPIIGDSLIVPQGLL